MRALALVVAAILVACTPPAVTPSPTPPPPSPSATAGASPTPSATAQARTVAPFARTTRVGIPADTFQLAIDRERIAFVQGGEVVTLDLASGARRTVHRIAPGWGAELDPSGLAGDVLVVLESRIDGQRTDGRVLRIDLGSGNVTTVDDFSGPFLGGGDTWRPRAPITNGSEVAWIRVDQDIRPFGVHVVVMRGGQKRTLQSGTSAVWIDLDADGRALTSTLIGTRDQAELVLHARDGSASSLASRPSEQGGPAHFVAGGVFWGTGAGIVRPITAGELISLDGRQRRPVDHGCAWIGSTARHIAMVCQGTGTRLIDLASREERALPGTGHRAGARGVAWTEGGEWWVGTLAP